MAPTPFHFEGWNPLSPETAARFFLTFAGTEPAALEGMTVALGDGGLIGFAGHFGEVKTFEEAYDLVQAMLPSYLVLSEWDGIARITR